MATLSEKKKVLKQAYKSKPTPTLKQVISIFDYLEKYRLPREERKQLLETIEKAYEKISARSLPPKQKVLKRETKGGKSLTELLKDFKAKFGKDKFREATKDTRDLVKDIERPALKKGKRIVSKRGYTTNQYGRFKNRVGTTYYETRSNRIDINQPSKTRYPKLAKGGTLAGDLQTDNIGFKRGGEMKSGGQFRKKKSSKLPTQAEISKMSDAELRKAFMQWASQEGVTDINSPNYEFKKGGKFSKGGIFGSSAKVDFISEEFASEDLINKLKKKLNITKNDVQDKDVIAFAYTDYGGTFYDKVAIEYFQENHPNNIVVENTGWGGKNAFVFGEPAKEYMEETEDYPLGYEDLESFYYEKESEEEQEGFTNFLNDIKRNYDFDYDEALEFLVQERSGYDSVTTTGLDYSESELIKFLEDEGIITKKQ